MNLSWRFSGGIIFSLTFHTFLTLALVYAYPDLKNRGERIWKEYPLFSNKRTPTSVSIYKNKEKALNIISTDQMIFPDLVVIRKYKKSATTNVEKIIPKQKYTLSNILTQLEKSPKHINVELSSIKQLSSPVVSLLSLLPKASMQSKVQDNKLFIITKEQSNITKFNSNGLKNYLNKLSNFFSKGWEVPIHLKESQVTVEIMFEINKNGKILNWKLEESGSKALHNSVGNLMKNLHFLPALPVSYPENSYIFGVRFSPTISQK